MPPVCEEEEVGAREACRERCLNEARDPELRDRRAINYVSNFECLRGRRWGARRCAKVTWNNWNTWNDKSEGFASLCTHGALMSA